MSEGGGGAPGRPSRTVMIRNRRGLHAIAAAKFVKLAETFEAEVTVRKNGTSVSGGSIMGLMMLAAGPGKPVTIEAAGAQAAEAVAALAALVDGAFDEE